MLVVVAGLLPRSASRADRPALVGGVTVGRYAPAWRYGIGLSVLYSTPRLELAVATEQQMSVSPASDQDRAIATITMAFSSDPIARWFLPDANRYLTYWPQVLQAFGGAAFAEGTADSIDDCGGVALWLPPGVAPDEETMGALTAEAVAPADQDEVFGFMEQMGELPPHRAALVPAVHRRRSHEAGPRLRLGAAPPCARALRQARIARLPRCHEPAEQAALRAPRI